MSINDLATSPTIEPTLQHAAEAMFEVQEREAAEAAAKLQREETPTAAGLPQYLTPESLVAYCDTRLSSLDSQMQSIFNEQQTGAATETALSNVATALNSLPQPSGSDTTVKITAQQMDQVARTFSTAIDAAGAGSTLGKALNKDLAALQTNFAAHSENGGSDSHMDQSAISNASQDIKTYASNLNSDSQVSMINLQSMMSQQQTAVELSTNLLQTLSQTANTIASNMKVG
jgi:hypothetical protein